MIGHLRTLIANAEKEIIELKIKIEEAKKELEICKQLKPILSRISDNSLNGYNKLQEAGNSLNDGIKVDGIGQGKNILMRADVISKLNLNSAMCEVNTQKRIEELESNILTWENKIKSLTKSIAGWKAEIARLEAIARAQAAARARTTVKKSK